MSDQIDLSDQLHVLVMNALRSGIPPAAVANVLDHQVQVMRIAAPIVTAVTEGQRCST